MKELPQDPGATRPVQPVVIDDRLAPGGDNHEPPEVRTAKELARRYRLTFVELLPTDHDSPINYTIFNEIPVDLMVRHQFLPLKRDDKDCTSRWRIQPIWNGWMSLLMH